MGIGSVAVEVRGLEKEFRIPHHNAATLKERALHPLRRETFDVLHALRDVSFDIGAGEFFGIVGRNGSGKSTLLKCLAGIYRPDAGTIRVAGRLAPFIELGVGFNPNLTARDNVLINSVMMGLTPREARARFDAIIDFAELGGFLDLELRNYSSGMQVRLAFAVMVQADADVMLIDEVLAVGDAAFQQKCLDAFQRLRDRGKTIVLVTHEMRMIERFCHRALLLEGGEVQQVGEPGAVGRHYLALNFQRPHAGAAAALPPAPGSGEETATATLATLHFDGAGGGATSAVGHGEPIRVRAAIEVHDVVEDAWVTLWLDTEAGDRLCGFSEPVGTVGAGEVVHVELDAANPLASGRYHLGWSLERGIGVGDFAAFHPRATDLIVFGGDTVGGRLAVEHRMVAEHGAHHDRAMSG
jgi:ABC-type polysaccharide/polyol phosphate transport system ATPase subunit